MRLLMYCVLFAQPHPEAPHVSGVGDRPLRVITSARLAAVVSAASSDDLISSGAHALTYAAVVDAVFAEHTVVPMRFGTAFANDDEVRSLLETQAERFENMLHLLNGSVEMSLRLTASGLSARAPGANGSGPGRAYLMERRSVGDELAARIERGLRGTFTHSKVEHLGSAADTRLALHFLVPRTGLEIFRAAVHDLERELSRELALTGPWPPYNFVV